jgi:hypothetical protein
MYVNAFLVDYVEKEEKMNDTLKLCSHIVLNIDNNLSPNDKKYKK